MIYLSGSIASDVRSLEEWISVYLSNVFLRWLIFGSNTFINLAVLNNKISCLYFVTRWALKMFYTLWKRENDFLFRSLPIFWECTAFPWNFVPMYNFANVVKHRYTSEGAHAGIFMQVRTQMDCMPSIVLLGYSFKLHHQLLLLFCLALSYGCHTIYWTNFYNWSALIISPEKERSMNHQGTWR